MRNDVYWTAPVTWPTTKQKKQTPIMAKKKELQTALVKHKLSVKKKVAKAVFGTKETIGGYYDAAAEEKLNSKQSK